MTVADSPRGRWRPRTVALRLRADDRLAGQAARGDRDAFGVLYERHHQSLYRYCRSIVGDPDDAADALQSAMTRALAAIARRNEDAPVRAWLFRIAHNESVSVIRRRHRAEPLEPESLIGPDVEADADRRRRLAQLVSDLQALPERQRCALLMRELSGLGHAEIATALQTSEGAVKQAIFEARTALYDFAAGREMACTAIRRRLSDGDGRTLRARPVRAHLRSCSACREFRTLLRAGRSELAAVAPVLPSATAAAVLESVIGGTAGGGAAGGAATAGGGLPVVLEISKTVAVGAATVTAGAGAVTYTAVVPEGRSLTPPEAAADAAPRNAPDGRRAAVAPDWNHSSAAAEAADRPGGHEAPERGPRPRAVPVIETDDGGGPLRQQETDRGSPGQGRPLEDDPGPSGHAGQDEHVRGPPAPGHADGSPAPVRDDDSPVPTPAGEDDGGSSGPAHAGEESEGDPAPPAPEPESEVPDDSAPAPTPAVEPEVPGESDAEAEPAAPAPVAETPTPDAAVDTDGE